MASEQRPAEEQNRLREEELSRSLVGARNWNKEPRVEGVQSSWKSQDREPQRRVMQREDSGDRQKVPLECTQMGTGLHVYVRKPPEAGGGTRGEDGGNRARH